MTNRRYQLVRLALALQNKPRMANKRIIQTLQHASDEQAAIEAAIDAGRPIVADDWAFADQILDTNERLGIVSYTFLDPSYPVYLKDVKDPPAMIHIRGNPRVLQSLPGIAVVGTRNVTENGREIARRLGQFLGENNWVVVSGLALGIDAAAHRGTLDGKGKTIAVLAGGLDKPNPRKNEELAEEILERSGAWVSEHPVGEPPRRQHFVPRNRIQVGLSAGSIIVEAEEKSGSISQANFCVEIGRPLFAVMPQDDRNTLGLRCNGTSFLVRKKGAIAIRSKSDYDQVLKVLERSKRHVLTSPDRQTSIV